MGIEYKNHELYSDSILIRNFVGRVGVEEIINSWKYLIENKLVNKKIKGVINNLIGCELKMDTNSFKSLMEYIKDKEVLKGLKLAVICDCPENIVFPLLGEKLVVDPEIKAFSTLSAAESWVIG